MMRDQINIYLMTSYVCPNEPRAVVWVAAGLQRHTIALELTKRDL